MRLLFLLLLSSEGPGALGFLPIRCILLLGNLMLRTDVEQKRTFQSPPSSAWSCLMESVQAGIVLSPVDR